MNTWLAHHGIKGQKWGVRRFQNPDGSLTAAGKKRYSWEDESDAEKAKRMVTDDTDHKRAEKELFDKMDKEITELEKPSKVWKENPNTPENWNKSMWDLFTPEYSKYQKKKDAIEDKYMKQIAEYRKKDPHGDDERAELEKTVFGKEKYQEHFKRVHELTKEDQNAIRDTFDDYSPMYNKALKDFLKSRKGNRSYLEEVFNEDVWKPGNKEYDAAVSEYRKRIANNRKEYNEHVKAITNSLFEGLKGVSPKQMEYYQSIGENMVYSYVNLSGFYDPNKKG